MFSHDDEAFDDAVEAFPLDPLSFLGRELVGVGGGVVDELGEQHGPAAARGRRAHHRWSVEGWPWRIDFSRADSRLIASSGSATSMSLRFNATLSLHVECLLSGSTR